MAYIYGDNSANALNGTGGSDYIYAQGGNDVVFANGGNDFIYGQDGSDEIYGQGGDDFIAGGAGADTIDGGAGSDTASYGNSSVGVYVDLDLGKGFLGSAAGDTLESVENLIGSTKYDILYGSSVANRIQGGGGDDRIDGRAGDDRLEGGTGGDTVTGGDGDDVLIGGTGADGLYGGNGADTASYAGAAKGVLIDLTNGQQTNDAAGDVFSSIERFEGSGHADTFRGNGGANDFAGSDGDDLFFGENGADELDGGSGDDLLQGGRGADFMTGGYGADLFLFTTLQDSGVNAADRDVIWDFKHAQGDKIDVANIDARTGNLLNDTFSFIGDDAFSAAGQVRYSHSGGTTVVELNVSGTSGAEMKITLAGVLDLVASDFGL